MGLKVPTTYCLSSRARARRGANRQDGSAHASRWEWIRIIFFTVLVLLDEVRDSFEDGL
jgi:hypothetical protein